MFDHVLHEAARMLRRADALLIGAGAGMGVDSGLPDFRGNQGFWKAYPPLERLGLSFVAMANPERFREDPELAWGFYGHRHNLYRTTDPHAGYRVLRDLGDAVPGGAFVFTSNVDGHFQKAGFPEDRILEAHGSLQHLQCTASCSRHIWEMTDRVQVDPQTFRAAPPLPSCPHCGAGARPNVLLFDDWEWISDRSETQADRYREWLERVRGGYLVCVEIGAGPTIPTVRMECERRGRDLIRINPRDPRAPAGGLSIPLPARQTLERIQTLLQES